MPQYKDQILDGKTVITSPNNIYRPETNDLVLQLRKRGISKVILVGMSANLCTQAHLYELLEQGFEVAVVPDATAAAKLPEVGGNLATITNFRCVANSLWTTDNPGAFNHPDIRHALPYKQRPRRDALQAFLSQTTVLETNDFVSAAPQSQLI